MKTWGGFLVQLTQSHEHKELSLESVYHDQSLLYLTRDSFSVRLVLTS